MQASFYPERFVAADPVALCGLDSVPEIWLWYLAGRRAQQERSVARRKEPEQPRFVAPTRGPSPRHLQRAFLRAKRRRDHAAKRLGKALNSEIGSADRESRYTVLLERALHRLHVLHNALAPISPGEEK